MLSTSDSQEVLPVKKRDSRGDFLYWEWSNSFSNLNGVISLPCWMKLYSDGKLEIFIEKCMNNSSSEKLAFDIEVCTSSPDCTIRLSLISTLLLGTLLVVREGKNTRFNRSAFISVDYYKLFKDKQARRTIDVV